MNSHFITNKGQRALNQDQVLIQDVDDNISIYLIADGMGGYENGLYAAKFIISSLSEQLRLLTVFDKYIIQNEIDIVANALKKENEVRNSKMGATLGGVIKNGNSFYCFWVGDVKIWNVKNGQIVFESKEHNLKNELIENRVFVEADNAKKYNHVVTRAIQNDIKKAKIDYNRIGDFEQGDYIILASDGVTDVLGNHQLLDIINSEKNVDDILAVIDDKLQETAKDNYSLILIN